MSTERNYGPTALATPANLLTAFRLLVSPLFIFMIIHSRISILTCVVGFLAAASDYFDGIVARRHGTTTAGAYLDPLADKILVLGGLYALIYVHVNGFIIPSIIITLREIWMSVHRSRAARRGVSIPASKIAKWKTFIQDWAIAFCVLPFFGHHLVVAYITIWVAAAFTVFTGWQYYQEGKKIFARAS